ncbi:hypothetical protein AB0I94_28340 [Streptomyces sp. NPDC050147]|uniref:hypothetical protein n=1 Tax=Streptomyces sp. NPDC050147 TaxID=3155513 RepID=UPI003423F44E
MGTELGRDPRLTPRAGVGEQQPFALEGLEHVAQRDGFGVRRRALGEPLGDVGTADLAEGAVALRAGKKERDRGVGLVSDRGRRAGTAARSAVTDDADPHEGFFADLRVHAGQAAVDPRVERVDAVVVEESEAGKDFGDPDDGTLVLLTRQRGNGAGLDRLVRTVDGGQ